jgi:integrase
MRFLDRFQGNPAHGIRIREADSKREPRYFRQPEVRRLLLKLEDPCRTVVLVAVSTGLRIAEILALRWKQIDLLQNTIEVAETYSSGEFGPPKTRSSRRTIPISASLAEVFKHLRPQNCEPERLVFATPKGTTEGQFLTEKQIRQQEEERGVGR